MNKILVIDDDEGILQALQSAFTHFGYDVRGAAHSREARRLINSFKPDMVVLDVLLSGESGVDMCRALKADDSTKDLPIVMISAHPSAERSVKECGADVFLPKPFSIEALKEAAERYLPRAPLGAAV